MHRVHDAVDALIAENEISNGDTGIDADGVASAASVAVARLRPTNPAATNSYLELPFTTISDYLSVLRTVSMAIAPAGARASIFLAAAASDFSIPPANLADHKIQSERTLLVDEGFELSLSPVPKALVLLRGRWCPEAFIVSFKLETDAALLLPKAAAAVARARVDAVVANVLETRYDELWVVGATALNRFPSPAFLSCCAALHLDPLDAAANVTSATPMQLSSLMRSDSVHANVDDRAAASISVTRIAIAVEKRGRDAVAAESTRAVPHNTSSLATALPWPSSRREQLESLLACTLIAGHSRHIHRRELATGDVL